MFFKRKLYSLFILLLITFYTILLLITIYITFNLKKQKT